MNERENRQRLNMSCGDKWPWQFGDKSKHKVSYSNIFILPPKLSNVEENTKIQNAVVYMCLSQLLSGPSRSILMYVVPTRDGEIYLRTLTNIVWHIW